MFDYLKGLPFNHQDPHVEDLRFGDKAELLVYNTVRERNLIYRYSAWNEQTREFNYVEVIEDLDHSLEHSPLYRPLFVSCGAQFYRSIPVQSPVAQAS